MLLWFVVDRTAVPAWAAGGFFAVWLLKEFAVYPMVRRAYERDGQTAGERLVGKTGRATEEIAPEGYIEIQGELWKAHLNSARRPAPKNSTVRVTGARGLTLTVEAETTR
jgi:membrane-bound serine protease (ClpP class)